MKGPPLRKERTDKMRHTFRGGSHVSEYKYTADREITEMPAPAVLSVMLSQHIGVPAVPLVKPGDRVLVGQMIADVTDGLGCPVHSPVSGKVKGFGKLTNAAGVPTDCIIIENDGLSEKDPSAVPYPKDITETDTGEIIAHIKKCGISGNGGASFPAYAKLRSAVGKVDTLIINGAECEPFLTADYRLMYELPEKIIGGAEILRHALGLERSVIAIEDNKQDAITAMSIAAGKYRGRVEIRQFMTKYPQGDERQLVYAVTGREIPTGKLPADAGCVIFNVSTCAAVCDAFALGMPMISRIVTVSGDCIRHPSNLLAPIGSSYKDIIEFCGGLIRTPKKVISGGPMMGFSVRSLDCSLTKGCSGILLFSERFAGRPGTDESACIRCGRCHAACPMHLMTNYIVSDIKRDDFDGAAALGLMSCVECGSCAYNCPARIPLVQYMRAGKSVIRSKTAGKQ